MSEKNIGDGGQSAHSIARRANGVPSSWVGSRIAFMKESDMARAPPPRSSSLKSSRRKTILVK